MSTRAAALTVLAVLLVALPALYWQLQRAVRESCGRDRAADARTRVGLPPAAPDNQPGTHLADLDECELIWATPSPDDDADWLRDAVRDAFRDAIEHRKEEEA
ncbi:hypothetical protein PV383_19760 [Streptomyces caniscabiei]|uniref:Secreted protein n=1 Tax=Streptomyces caniscabiei TaxID=2746961 RepID=A0ABU4MQG4_9ACTN|nr:hypothetical protein [Streptomyces caniscabiei]MDX3039396.1 hypothetical protein [Streptomyces caniscabiei]